MKKQTVYLILSDYKGDLNKASKIAHHWICNSKINTPKIKKAWKLNNEYSEGYGVTAFDLEDNIYQTLYNFLASIDEHHSGDEVSYDKWWKIIVEGINIDEVDQSELENIFPTAKYKKITNKLFEIIQKNAK